MLTGTLTNSGRAFCTGFDHQPSSNEDPIPFVLFCLADSVVAKVVIGIVYCLYFLIFPSFRCSSHLQSLNSGPTMRFVRAKRIVAP